MYTVIGIRKEQGQEILGSEPKNVLVAITASETQEGAIESAKVFIERGIHEDWRFGYGPYTTLAVVGEGSLRMLNLETRTTLTLTRNTIVRVGS